MPDSNRQTRRDFLQSSAAAAAIVGLGTSSPAPVIAEATTAQPAATAAVFAGPDSLVHPGNWESLNPGYWQIKNGALRRRLTNVGDRARSTGFPFHSATRGQVLQTDYDPSLPAGIIYRNDWKLKGRYSIKAVFTYRAAPPEAADGDDPSWKLYSGRYGQIGIAIGAKSLQESYNRVRTAHQVVWSDDNTLRILNPSRGRQKNGIRHEGIADASFNLQPGDQMTMTVNVTPRPDGRTTLDTILEANGHKIRMGPHVKTPVLDGYVGVIGRGLVDFEVNEFQITPFQNTPLNTPKFDCYTCYPLGDTLQQIDGKWQCRFVSLFASDGQAVQIRIADSAQPKGGWQSVPVAGQAKIVNNEWRRNTATITATLPDSPSQKTQYYTVWKDGVDVTPDTRGGTDACGPGTGLVGDVPATGQYIGRLPQLNAPYKMCGLSCHAITSGLQQHTADGWKILGGGAEWQVRDQPTVEAYKHLEDYDFQVLVWEDDVWYMELVLYPPSTDDAYKVVTHSICGPTSRWQMMRHWNVINPGDHDYGMDDVKGPEQIALRKTKGLGQDPEYIKRNFQIVHHLITGDEDVDPLINPKKWRAWKMPDRDFTFAILDSRLWRSSQDTDMWDDAGWGAFKNLYDRTDPTRSLLGEEQFAWLQDLIHTDSSRLICLTGINGMHTVWAGTKHKGAVGDHVNGAFDQRDRVTADYAGWVKAGADRVIELLGSRDGIVTVYGDVHNGCIMKNVQHGLIECSFGPIGRSGGRAVIPGFGPDMKDFDGRQLDVTALYHKTYVDPLLTPPAKDDPFYWNFLEMEFNPQREDPAIGLRIRNLVDAPSAEPRGGSALETTAGTTGRRTSSQVAEFKTLPNADVRFVTENGKPIRGTRSDQDGRVVATALIDIPAGTTVVVTAYDQETSASQVLKTT